MSTSTLSSRIRRKEEHALKSQRMLLDTGHAAKPMRKEFGALSKRLTVLKNEFESDEITRSQFVRRVPIVLLLQTVIFEPLFGYDRSSCSCNAIAIIGV